MGRRRRSLTRAWPIAGAALVVIAGVAAQVVRPTAGDVGPLLPEAALFDADFLARAATYRRPVELASLAALLLRVVVAAALGFTPVGRRWIDALLDRLGEHGRRRPALASAAVVLAAVIATDLLILPLAFWIGYVHDGAFGLRTSTAGGWFTDWLAIHGPAWIGVAVATAGGYAAARRLPRTWPFVLGAAAGLLGGVVLFAAPLVLEPLQFRMQPLGEGPVRDEVQRVLTAAGMPRSQILVADASRRTTRQNAYVSGVGATRRIVLYDTLVEARPPREIGVILAHEIGHRRNGDLWRSAMFGAAGSMVTAYVLAMVARIRTSRGHQRAVADPRGAGAVYATAAILVVLSLPLQHAVSRRAESAADVAALELTSAGEVMVRMQRALTIANLGDPLPPRWVQLLWGSHPAAVERMTRARRWAGERP